MQLPEAIRKRIFQLMEQNHIKSVNALAKLAGISNGLNDFMKGTHGLITIGTVLHICEAFNIELYDFFNSPLFKDVKYEK